MPRTQEIPQVYPENIPMVSMFQGYNPETMAQVEGPQQGGWVPLMQDPITMGAIGGGGAAVAGIPGMFAQLAQMYGPQMVPQAGGIGQPSVMGGYRPGWQKIPNTTEPDLGQYGSPTIRGRNVRPPGYYAQGGGLGPDWANQTRTYGEPMSHRKSVYGKGTQDIGDEGFATPTQPFTARENIGLRDLQEQKSQSIFKSTGRELTDEELQGMSRSRPIGTGDLHRMLQDWLRLQKQKEGWTRIPIQTGPPTTSVDEMLRMHGTPARPTAPFTVVPGQQVLGGGAPTTELPSLTDLFRGIPE